MSYAPDKNREYLQERYRSQRDGFISMLGGECNNCGSSDRLEIDHIDWRTKSFRIGKLWGDKSLPKVYKELEKCQLLCYSCHREKSRQDLREQRLTVGFTHGTIYGWMKARCDCRECSVAKRTWHDERNAKRRKGPGYGPRF